MKLHVTLAVLAFGFLFLGFLFFRQDVLNRQPEYRQDEVSAIVRTHLDKRFTGNFHEAGSAVTYQGDDKWSGASTSTAGGASVYWNFYEKSRTVEVVRVE